MAYQNYKLYLGYTETPNSSYIVTNKAASSWHSYSIGTGVNITSFMAASFPLPAGSDYVLVSSSSSYESPAFSLSIAAPYVVQVLYSKHGFFTAAQIQAIEASTVSFSVKYTARKGSYYKKINFGTNQIDGESGTYTYSGIPDTTWRSTILQHGRIQYVTSITLDQQLNLGYKQQVSNVVVTLPSSSISITDTQGSVRFYRNRYILDVSFVSSEEIPAKALALAQVGATISYILPVEIPAEFNIKNDIKALDWINLNDYVTISYIDTSQSAPWGFRFKVENAADREIVVEWFGYVSSSDGIFTSDSGTETIAANDIGYIEIDTSDQNAVSSAEMYMTIKATLADFIEYEYEI